MKNMSMTAFKAVFSLIESLSMSTDLIFYKVGGISIQFNGLNGYNPTVAWTTVDQNTPTEAYAVRNDRGELLISNSRLEFTESMPDGMEVVEMYLPAAIVRPALERVPRRFWALDNGVYLYFPVRGKKADLTFQVSCYGPKEVIEG